MNYQEALKLAHEILEPNSYFEIGCREGLSLSLAKCPSIAVDPDFEIRFSLSAPTRIFRQTSDDFFARTDTSTIMEDKPDLAFIDGMHQVEFALRDFINLEKFCSPSSVILIDDVLPKDMSWTTREREGQYWTGDVYRLIPLLREFRPDLQINVFNIEIKGLAVITNLDPDNRILINDMNNILESINGGKWLCDDLDSLTKELLPRPPSTIKELYQEHKSYRAVPHMHSHEKKEGRYLELLKKSLLNEIYLDDELRIQYLKDCIEGKDIFSYHKLHNITEIERLRFTDLKLARLDGRFLDRNIKNSGFSHTMMGRKRLDSLHECLEKIRVNGVSGDLVECGVWRGGGCIFMAGYLKTFDMGSRRIFVADSFDGLPKPSLKEDIGMDLSKEQFPELAVSLETVKDNFRSYDLLDNNVVFLKGWFKNTLSIADTHEICLLRLDGDYYESTMDILSALYDKVVPGGIIIVDDYALGPCKQAVSDFLSQKGLKLPILQTIDWTGIWWAKS